MSSRKGKSAVREGEFSSWSEWRWSEKWNCFERYRQVGDDWEWGYAQENEITRDRATTPRMPISSSQYEPATLESNYSNSRGVGGGDEVAEDIYAPSTSSLTYQNDDIWSPPRTSYNTLRDDTSCSFPGCGKKFKKTSDRDRHYQTVHANNAERSFRCKSEGCPAGVQTWANSDGLRAHNKKWHGPYQCEHFGCSRGYPNGFASKQDLERHMGESHQAATMTAASYQSFSLFSTSAQQSYSNSTYDGPDITTSLAQNPQIYGHSSGSMSYAKPSYSPQISSANSTPYQKSHNTKVTRVTKHNTGSDSLAKNELFAGYKKLPSKSFIPGMIFKTLWSEPSGRLSTGMSVSKGDDSSSDLSDEEVTPSAFTKIRRFVILRTKNGKGYSTCLAIHTYGRRGVMKPGVNPEEHAQMYSGIREEPLSGEVSRGLFRKPIAINLDIGKEKIDSMSRLNYGKIYTIEHNVKICRIGQVTPKSLRQMLRDYDAVNPPVSSADSGTDAEGGAEYDSSNIYQQEQRKTSERQTSSSAATDTNEGPASTPVAGYPMTGYGYQFAQTFQPSHTYNQAFSPTSTSSNVNSYNYKPGYQISSVNQPTGDYAPPTSSTAAPSGPNTGYNSWIPWRRR